MCMKEDNPGQKNIKGDNFGFLCDLTHSSSSSCKCLTYH